MNSATKFIDFFVHDILDYTILKKDGPNFTKNISLFNVKDAVSEIIETLDDKVKMKDIVIEERYIGWDHSLSAMAIVKTDQKRF